ncbi:MAG: hypothetical protein P1V13_16985 [Rhizobiaceae bacterium]|nr:hypothetical protein [Rhizobiaceae bacterium]
MSSTQSFSVFIDTIIICSCTAFVIMLGAVAPGATSVFSFPYPMMGIVAMVDLLALAMLFPIALRVLKDFRWQLKAGVDRPVFDQALFPDLDIDASAWTDRD